MVKVEELMTPEPVCVSPATSLDEATLVMDEKDVRHLPVVEEDQLVGVVSDRDLLELTGWLSRDQRRVLDAPNGPVGEHSRKSPVTIRPEDELELALDVVLSERIGCLPVTREGKLLGLLTEMDLLATYVTDRSADQDLRAASPPVGSCMTPSPRTLSIDAPVDDALELFSSRSIRHVPVMRGEELVGILSDRDLRLERGRGGLEGLAVGDLMTADPLTMAHDAPLFEAADQMIAAKVSAIPVLEGEQLVGILCLADVLSAWLTSLRA